MSAPLQGFTHFLSFSSKGKENDVQPQASSKGEALLAPLTEFSISVQIFKIKWYVLQSMMLQIAASWIEQEKMETEAAKEAYMAENCPAPDLSGDHAVLLVRRASLGRTESNEL